MNEPMEINAHSQPLTVFAAWMKEAQAHPHIREATAMALATSDAGGAIHNRIVLCKSWSDSGLHFYTNYLSQKGRELASHPMAGAVFYWDPLARQIRVSGPVTKLSRAVSQEYWRSRPRESQLSQYVSKQSESLSSREELQLLWRQAELEFAGREIPCPEHWGGYSLEIKTLEFWLGQPGRLHDRYQFEKTGKAWTFRRLYP